MLEKIKKNPRVIAAAAVAAVLLLAATLWYIRPMGFLELLDGVDPSGGDLRDGAGITYVTNSSLVDGNTPPDLEYYSLDEDSPLIDELLELLTSQTYRRRLSNLLPKIGGETLSGRSAWQVVLGGGSYSLVSYDAVTGIYMVLFDLRDDSATSFRCSVDECEQFRQAVYELLSSADPNAV